MRPIFLFTAAFLAAPAVLAQASMPEDRAASQAATETKPVDAAGMFAAYEGDWSCEGHLVPSGRALASHLSFRLLSPNVLAKTHRDRAPGRYVAQEVWTATPDGAFSSAIGSASGIRMFAGQREEHGITWDRITAGEDRTERFVYAFAGSQVMTVEWWRRRDGVFAMGDTLRCEKGIAAGND